MKRVTESIYNGISCTVPLADVQHIQKRGNGDIMIVMKSTTWNAEISDYNNGIFLRKDEAVKFMQAWCDYRHELEFDTLMDWSTSEKIKKDGE